MRVQSRSSVHAWPQVQQHQREGLRMNHIEKRIAERVSNPDMRDLIYKRCEQVKKGVSPRKSFAVRVVRLAQQQGQMTFEADGSGVSNGETGVVVVRNGNLHTFMWRRNVQPHTAEALRVDAVTCFDD